MEHCLWYQSPAENFTEALPLGNGCMGAMVYGGYPKEKISLNLDTLWSGYPKHYKGKQKKAANMERIRNLLEEKKYWEAQNEIQGELLGCNNESYLSAGWLSMEFEEEGEQESYKRKLLLLEGRTLSVRKTKGQTIKEEIFLSSVRKGMYIRISVEGKPASVKAGFHTKLQELDFTGKQEGPILLAQAPSHVEPNYVASKNPVVYDMENPGMKYVLFLGVAHTDGTVWRDKQEIEIKNFHNLEIFVYGETGFVGWDEPLCTKEEEFLQRIQKRYEKDQKERWENIFREHMGMHSALYGRTELCLQGQEGMEKLPTDKRLEMVRKGNEDTGLSVLLFHYSRYLMLASSGGSCCQPGNLQGIWCEDVRSVWSSNWTVNINTEMNYWICGPGNLTECEEPLIHLVEDLKESGKEAADNLGCRGFAVHHNVDLWRQPIPALGEVKWAYWPMGGLWLTTHLYRHYLYTQDIVFLEKQVYPVYQSCTDFLLDYLYKGEQGYYQSSPSTSPENTFLDSEGRECGACISSVMDVTLLREICSNMKEIIEELGLTKVETERLVKMDDVLKHLPPFQVGSKGQLLEWQEEYPEGDQGHRHFAHLIGFHPFHQINREDTPELLKAVEKTLERRLQGQKKYIGWNCAWLANFYARLFKGEKAGDCIRQLLSFSVYDNLFDLHPPLGENEGEREIFQIDGNFGIGAAIAEMLIQCRQNIIHLLPALPPSWKEGSVKGLLAYGAVEVSMSWEKQRLTRAVLRCRRAGRICVQYEEPFEIFDEERHLLGVGVKKKELWTCSFMSKADGIYEAVLEKSKWFL